MKNIVLTGFMGSGKSSVGEGLARKMGMMRIIDTDGLIEEKMCMSINNIFATQGEPFFRTLEKSVVKEVSGLENYIIVTGGGVVLDKDNITSLRSKGVIVYLHVSPEGSYERVKGETHRPLLKVTDPLGQIRELMENRKPFYDDNDIEVDTTGLTVEEVVDVVIRKVEPLLSG